MSLEALCALSGACFVAALIAALATPSSTPPARAPAISARQATARRVVQNPRVGKEFAVEAPQATTRRSVPNPRAPAVGATLPAPVAREPDKGPWLKSQGVVFTPKAPMAHPPQPDGGEALAATVGHALRNRGQEPNLRHLYRRGLNRLAESHEHDFLRNARRDPSLRPVRSA